MPCIAVDINYEIVNKDHSYDLVELQLQKISKNLGAIRKDKNTSYKFGSFLISIYFYEKKSFPTIDIVAWDRSRSTMEQISDLIRRSVENFEEIMGNYFEEFKEKMRSRMIIPKYIIKKYYDKVYFIVDTNFVYAQEISLRISCLRPMPYEVNVDETTIEVTTVLAK